MKSCHCLLSVLALTLGGVAHAAAPTTAEKQTNQERAADKPWAEGVSASAQSSALALFRKGNEALNELRYEDALLSYREAVSAWKHPAIYFNIAVCHIHRDRQFEALAALDQALTYGEAALGPDLYQEALTYRKLLRSQLAKLVLSVTPEDAALRVDGKQKQLNSGQLVAELLAGEHVLIVERPGFYPLTHSFTLAPGSSSPLALQLKPIAPQVERLVRPLPVAVPYWLAGTGILSIGAGVLLRELASQRLEGYDAALVMSCSPGCRADSLSADVLSLKSEAATLEASSYSALALGSGLLLSGVGLAIWNQPRRGTEERRGTTFALEGPRLTLRGQF